MKTDLKKLYYQINEYISNVDFSKLWDGFRPLKFALYNDKECFFDGEYIQKTDDFIANTAISHNGEIIAIWNVVEDRDTIVLTSKIIHEMFHGFQMINEESRFPNEMDALYNYKYDVVNLSYKLEENRIIVKLLENFNFEQYKKLLSIRKYRMNHFPYEYNYESCIEQIEGSAEFVELNVLKQLSNELYLKKIQELKKGIINQNNLLPIRIVCYNTGALFLKVLSDNSIEYKKEFIDMPISSSMLENINEYTESIELTMKETINSFFERIKGTISKTIEKNDLIINCSSKILGLNIYDAVYYDKYIISKYFVMHEYDNNQKVEYGNFLIETNEIGKMSKLYKI